jgi:carbon-monoxide dehydrogenase medium subunit
MKPAPFLYRAPTTLERAVDDLAECAEEGGKVIAGGQSLLPMLNYRLVRPPVLVDLGRVAELKGRAVSREAFSLGATTTTGWVARSAEAREAWPLMSVAASWVGHAQIRSRGTVGGSVAHADPSAEMCALMVLAEARLTMASSRGTRVEQAEDFILGYLTTSLEEDEILTSIDFEVPNPGGRWGFEEFAPRHGDFAEAGAACTLPSLGGEGCGRAVAFGIADKPFRLRTVESLLTGSTRRVSRRELAEAAGEDFDTAGTIVADKGSMGIELVVRTVSSAGVAID